MEHEPNTVALIGGLGKMGVVTSRLLQEAGHPVIISDIKDPTTYSPREAIERAGIVFFSVLPIENIDAIIRATIDVFDQTHCVLDNASVKSSLQPSYGTLDRAGVSICSTHPLCKPDQPFLGQNCLIAPFGEHPLAATLIAEDVYGRAGMVLRQIDFDKHDSTMVFLQGLPHIVNRVVTHVLAETGIDLETLLALSTANSRLFLLANGRTFVQRPEISDMLISSGLRTSEGQQLVQALRKGIDTFVQAAASGELAAILDRDANLLDPSGRIRVEMNDVTTGILTHLANPRIPAALTS